MRVSSNPLDGTLAAAITGSVDEARPEHGGNTPEALQGSVENAERRLRNAEAGKNPAHIAAALYELGLAELASGATDAAVATLELADQQFATLSASVEHARLLLALCNAYESVERFSEALKAHRRYHQLAMNLARQAREDSRPQESAEAQLFKTRNELTFALRRQSELAEINAHLLRMERQRTELLQQAERFSLEDSVTQVNNRRCLDVRLAADVQRARRYASPLTIAMVDIDNFKSINDRFTHANGDEVLRRVAAVMRTSLRDSDYVARYGGDEFVLVFPETRLTNARMVCEMVRERVAAEDWSAIGPDVKITVSLGVAERSPNTNSPDLLLNAADRMLYRAKRAGKNSVAPIGGKNTDLRQHGQP